MRVVIELSVSGKKNSSDHVSSENQKLTMGKMNTILLLELTLWDLVIS